MSIIGALPVNLANGTEADASQVMTDLNFIVNAVNANAQPAGSYSTAGTLDAPSGTRMLFHQASAPTGWTVDATINDHALRVTGSGGGIVSGFNGFTLFVSGGMSTDGHVLATSEIPAHTHNVGLFSNGGAGFGPQLVQPGNFSGASATTDGGTGGGAAHSHTIGTKFNYITCMVCQKS